MIKLIINADDFGRNKTCTQAILEFMEQGLVSNTTLMVTEPYAAVAMNEARRCGVENRVGLHLNLTEGRPLTHEITAFSQVCDESGMFNGSFHRSLKSRLYLPRQASVALEKEIKAQLEKYVALGGKEFHLDSHHHSHTDFAVARILFPLAKKMGFRTCRLSRDSAGGALKTLYKGAFNAFARAHFRAVQAFVDENMVQSNPDRWEGKVVEIMTHPVRCANGEIDAADQVNQGVLEHETKVSDLGRFVEKLSGRIQLISYGEL